MCGTCGCDDGGAHAHHDPHDHHDHHHEEDAAARARTLRIEEAILGRNDRRAAVVRGWLAARGASAVNLIGSPGAGKTTLVERTVRALAGVRQVAVVEGDQATENDAVRVRAAGAPVVQINTDRGCHLEADAVDDALRALEPKEGALVLVENVGNLVCPALFDLGERARVVVASVPEGDDKPEKFPHVFRTADCVVLNKVDLLRLVPFSLERFREGLARVCPRAGLIEVSAWRGTGIDRWLAWLEARVGPALARAGVGEEVTA